MTSRVPELSNARLGQTERVGVTPTMVDAAVNEVLRQVDDATRRDLLALWSLDDTTEAAQMLQRSIVAQQGAPAFGAAARTKVVVDVVLDEEEVQYLTENYPDFDLSFQPRAGADHGLPATVRKLGTRRCVGNLPPGVAYKDVGGSIVMHVLAGDKRCVVVAPIADGKDPMREAMNEMRLRRIVERHAEGDPGISSVSAEMARSVLAGEGRYYVRADAREDETPAVAGIMVHVYDIPLADLPKVMDKAGMAVLEGEMHFSNRFYEEAEGELPSIGARYKIDRDKDMFRMGFLGSTSRWYPHRWSEFQRYGADQVLQGREHVYSYKIVERRGDTITFRVLRLGGAAHTGDGRLGQRYATPVVPSVVVRGTEMQPAELRKREQPKPCDYVFPRDTWEKMTRSAAVDISKGRFSFNDHVNAYRTLLATHKYNGVAVNEARVPIEQVAPLALLSGVYAFGQIALLRNNIKATIEFEMDKRVLADYSVLGLAFKTFLTAVRSFGTWVFGPLAEALGNLEKVSNVELYSRLVTVAPVPRYRVFPASVFAECLCIQATVDTEDVYRGHMADRLELDVFVQQLRERVAEQARQARLDKVRVEATLEGESTVVASGKGSVVGSSTATSGVGNKGVVRSPLWVPVDHTHGEDSQVYTVNASAHSAMARRAAVQEAEDAVYAEIDALDSQLSNRYRSAVVGGRPQVGVLRNNREAWRAPDLWWVTNNVLAPESVLGHSASEFAYSGAYCPQPVAVQDKGGTMQTCLRAVREVAYTATGSSTGATEDRVHYLLDAPDYTGYVYVSAEMEVFNGYPVAQALRAATDVERLTFEMCCYKGGPGAGKTYAITHRWKKGDLVMSPLRKSVEAIRAKLRALHGISVRESNAVVRTVDSHLVMYGLKGKAVGDGGCTNLYIDEVYNTLPGRVYAVAALVGARRVTGYGDQEQIPPVVRADLTRMYLTVEPEHVVKTYVVYRGAPEIVALFAAHYGHTLRTVNKNVGEVRVLHTHEGFEPAKDCRILVMNQADKLQARKWFPQYAHRVCTTHEAQGEDVDQVVLLKIDRRVRAKDDPFDLYSNDKYVNVAISRARRSFVYLQVSDRDDKIRGWIQRGADPRRISAVADVASAGRAIEFR